MLCNVFIIKKSRHYAKNNTIFVTFFIQKPGTLRYAIFHGIFEIGVGWGHFYMQKAMHFALHFYMEKKCTLSYVFTYKKPDTLGYIFIFKAYRIVLIPNYKHAYD